MSDQFNNQPVKNDSATSIEQLQKQLSKQTGHKDQNFSMAIVAGFFAALIGAIIWATVTYFSGYQIGWMAVGIGFVVGIAIKEFGKGDEIQFGIAGALLSLLGCLFGNLFTSVIYIATQEAMGVFEVLFQLDFAIIVEIMIDTFYPMDLLFYGLAVYYGFKYSIVTEEVTEEEKELPDQPNLEG